MKLFIHKTNGNNKTNSTSNTKKIREIRKNRIENGSREMFIGVKPHSKGLFFSNEYNDFFLNLTPSLNNNKEKIKEKKIDIINTSIKQK